jgi:hypothetical protein
MDMLGQLLKLVIDGDSSRARGGELAIYNNLVISVPVDEEWLQVQRAAAVRPERIQPHIRNRTRVMGAISSL